jgi:hypothetical protein
MLPQDLQFDVEIHLKARFPILFELLDGNKINWKQINKTFKNQYLKYHDRGIKLQQSFRIEASFYNIITSAMKGDAPAQRLLDFIQKLFEELVAKLDPSEKKEIKPTVFGFLSNMDLKYLNFLGELAVLNLYKTRLGYKLVKVEAPVSAKRKKGISVDFQFYDESKNTLWHLEVMNIHLNDKNTSELEAIQNLLVQKIDSKISATQIKQHPHIFLVPVLWGQFTEIEKIRIFYQSQNPLFFNTSTPVCFATFTNESGNKFHKFGTIDTIFEGINIVNSKI